MLGRGVFPEGWRWDLPSEVRWEYACRAGTSGAYSADLENIAWYNDNSGNVVPHTATGSSLVSVGVVWDFVRFFSTRGEDLGPSPYHMASTSDEYVNSARVAVNEVGQHRRLGTRP